MSPASRRFRAGAWCGRYCRRWRAIANNEQAGPSANSAIVAIVNADDFGLSEGVDRAIEASFHDGVLRSASIMANGAAFEDAVRIAAATPGLGVGVHLTFVGERSVAPVPELGGMVDANGLLPAGYAAFAKGYATRSFGLAEIRRETDAQVKRILDAGIVPTHLDSHQHIHLLPGVFGVAAEAAAAAGIAVIRTPVERLRMAPNGRAAQLKVLTLLAARARKRAAALRLRTVDTFWGLACSGSLDEAHLLGIGGKIGPGINEIMAHPGYADDAFRARYDWGYHWDDEAAALCSKQVASLLCERGVRLSHFGEI